jgi:3-oxoacyl-[acyl-carrier protein] reductase
MSASTCRTIVVTGGSKGIGRAVCIAFAAVGNRVRFNYASDEEGARETERLAADAGGEAVGFRVDVSSETEVAAFVKKVLEADGRIDVLVNNAGITRDGLVVRMRESDWDRVLDINLKGAYLATRFAVKPMMKQRYGRIVNITSVVGVSGNPGQANYVASKAGLIGLTKSVAQELASRGITANAVAPGFIETDMTRNLPEKARSAMLDRIPAGRAGTPEEVARAVLFLASGEADYITGQVLHVGGGLYM